MYTSTPINKNTEYISIIRVICFLFLILLRRKCQTRFFSFWRNSWPDFYCTMFYHFNTWVRTCFW